MERYRLLVTQTMELRTSIEDGLPPNERVAAEHLVERVVDLSGRIARSKNMRRTMRTESALIDELVALTRNR